MIPLINGPAPTQTAQKFWNVVSAADTDAAEITMYGDVCAQQPVDWWTGEPEPGMYITPEGFLDDLAQIKDKGHITIKLNSCGGDLYTGIAIHNALKGLKGHKTVIIEGIAASAASVIACAGDDVQVYPGSMIMIHGVAGMFRDYMTIGDLKQAIKGFDAAEQAIAEIYHAKTGTDTDTLRSMMTKETWMVGQTAVDKGFANTLLGEGGPAMSLSADKKVLLVAGVRHDVKAFHNIPGDIPVTQGDPAAPAAGTNNKTRPTNKAGGKNEGGNNPMTEQELRAQHPELVASIERAAVEAARTEIVASERARLQAIESIEAQIGDSQLIADAKYGENACDAAQLALKAMQKQAAQGAAHLAGVKNDAANSGAGEVTGTPNGGNSDNGEDDKAEFAGIINAYKSISGGRK
jgi:ATP-dependent protease ClpP protease subunit